MKDNKKAFTIVELVIVIAVIAILAAVLIPTFSNLIKRSKESADQQLIRNLNTALKADLNDHPTMTAALKAAEEFGYDVGKINASATDNEILWDSVNDAFCYLDGDEIKYIPDSADKSAVKDVDYWIIKKVDSDSDLHAKYSTYLKPDSTATALNTAKGIDVGTCTTVTSITYTNTGAAQDVIIRTNGGTLTVNDTNAASHQTFYGYADTVEVTTGTACFVAHGVIGEMELKAGKAIADSGAFIGLIKAVAGTTAEEINGGIFVIPAGTDASDIDGTVAGYTVEGDTITPSAEKSTLAEKASEEFIKDLTENNDGTVAVIGSRKFNSFNKAVAEASEKDIIVVVSDFVIDSSIGESSLVGAINSKVVLSQDTTITFKEAAKVYFKNNCEFKLNGHILTVNFDISCDIENERSGFMNCSIPLNYGGKYVEYHDYSFEGRNAYIKCDFYGIEKAVEEKMGLVYYSQAFHVQPILVGGATDGTSYDNVAYDDVKCTSILLDEEEQIQDVSQAQASYYLQEDKVARIYLKIAGAVKYEWQTYTNNIGWEKSTDNVDIVKNNNNWVIIKGINGEPANGKQTKIVATVTLEDGTKNEYTWRFDIVNGEATGNTPINPPIPF